MILTEEDFEKLPLPSKQTVELSAFVKAEEIDEYAANQLASDIAHKIEESLDYPGQIKVCVVRETRSIDYAR